MDGTGAPDILIWRSAIRSAARLNLSSKGDSANGACAALTPSYTLRLMFKISVRRSGRVDFEKSYDDFDKVRAFPHGVSRRMGRIEVGAWHKACWENSVAAWVRLWRNSLGSIRVRGPSGLLPSGGGIGW